MKTTEERALERMEVCKKKRRALELRLAKVSYRRIADELDINVATAHAWVKELTAIDLPQEEMDQIRQHEAEGYDASENRLLTMMSLVAERAEQRRADGQAYGYEVEQINSLEKTLAEVRKQRAILLGINRPQMVKHNITVRTVLDDEIELLVSELSGGGNIMSDPNVAHLVDTDG